MCAPYAHCCSGVCVSLYCLIHPFLCPSNFKMTWARTALIRLFHRSFPSVHVFLCACAWMCSLACCHAWFTFACTFKSVEFACMQLCSCMVAPSTQHSLCWLFCSFSAISPAPPVFWSNWTFLCCPTLRPQNRLFPRKFVASVETVFLTINVQDVSKKVAKSCLSITVL